MSDNSIDSVVTDPPYELGFMGKAWDKTGVAYNVDLWKEVLRVLKPGGHLLSFGGTRTYHRMTCAIEDAGFEIRDQIQWIYGSGFPKSLDISKAIDKEGKRYLFFDEVRNFLLEHLKISNLKLADINNHLGFANNGSGMAGHWFGNITQQSLPTKEQWFKLKGLLKFGNKFDEIFMACVNPNERPIIGLHPNPASEIFQGGKLNKEVYQTSAATKEAKQWEGWGTGLKPSNEPICMTRKPLSEKTVALNVLKWGTGGINIDGCRIESNGNKLRGGRNSENYQGTAGEGWDRPWRKTEDGLKRSKQNADAAQNKAEALGRWPANIIHDGSEEVVALFPNTKSGFMKKGTKRLMSSNPNKNTYGHFDPDEVENDTYGDSGSASRFFYCAKASKSERGEGNQHPTVKPIALMQYLCRLITPPVGIVLDPFMGSGTTGIGAINEGFSFIGTELSPEYFEIAQKRIEAAKQRLIFNKAQQKLF